LTEGNEMHRQQEAADLKMGISFGEYEKKHHN
jgi:hypothetical protein